MELRIKKNTIPKNKVVEVSKSPKIVAYNNGIDYFAVSGICPHAKWPLELGFVKNNTLTCGGHGWEFNITNGKCTSNLGRDLKKFKITENGEEIIISD